MTNEQAIERMQLKLVDAEANIPKYTGAILDAEMYRIAIKAMLRIKENQNDRG